MMDTLAQYGSDSSSDSDEGVALVSVHVSSNAAAAATKGGYVKDDETKTPIASLPAASASCENSDNHPESSRKRRRRWDMPQPKASPTSQSLRENEGPLPPPPLGSTTSLTYWDKDYLSNSESAFAPPEDPVWSESQQQRLTEKLNQLHETFSLPPPIAFTNATTTTIDSSSSSWALHLKGQQEFHNPHFLNSVISHFRLNVLGSNIPQQDVVEEFEYNLVAMEEEARYRQQQQLQFQPPFDPTLYAGSAPSSSSSFLIQSDMERAMRGQYK